MTAAERLAAYVAELRYDDLPPEVVEAAKRCLIDAVACAVFGSGLPWSRLVLDYVRRTAAAGPCHVPGALERRLPPGPAALCLGAFAHAFELDSLRKPGAGVHPGATVALPALVTAQAAGADGRALIAAIVAGCEVMFRIGDATLHTPEARGFHAPGVTGAFGAAAAAGRLSGLNASQLTQAFGLAGSMTGGLLAFADAGRGGMVKRLHLGRAAEAGIVAAELARDGFEGPSTVLEGRFGLLDAFCERAEPERLTAGLGARYEILRLCLKRYACHVTAQAPIQLLRRLMHEQRLEAGQIAGLTLEVSEKVLSHHAERRPADLMLAQYSVPFSVALAAHRDLESPRAFSKDALSDPAILGLVDRLQLRAGRAKGWGVSMVVECRDGVTLRGEQATFRGCPEDPFTDEDLARKFFELTAEAGAGRMHALFDALCGLEQRAASTIRAWD